MSRRAVKGFSLLEAMLALVVLLVALVGALAGLISAAQEFRQGQLRQAKMALVEARSQRLVLDGRQAAGSIFTSSTPPPASSYPAPNGPETYAPGAAPWFVDPEPPVPGDLSTGAYFRITPDGKIVPDSTVGANTDCGSVPKDVYCRELVVLSGTQDSPYQQNGTPQATNLLNFAPNTLTVFIRVSRKGEDPVQAVVQRDVWVGQ